MSRARFLDPSADGPGKSYEAQDLVSAVAVAFIVLFGFILMFQSPPRALTRADITDEKAQPIAVSITPVPLLKLGSKTPSKLPDSWQRQAPRPAQKQEETPLPSTQAAKTPDAIPSTAMPDAAAAPVLVDAAAPGPTDPAAVPTDASTPTTASSTQGDPNGSPNGTETDPLKARAADLYRNQIAQFFLARFAIRGKLPFDKLKTLRAGAIVTVAADRTVTGFSVSSSGDPTFDAEMKNALQSRVGALIPPPPPMYPQLQGSTIHVAFSCTVQAQCE